MGALQMPKPYPETIRMPLPDRTPEEIQNLTTDQIIEEINKLVAEMAARSLPKHPYDARDRITDAFSELQRAITAEVHVGQISAKDGESFIEELEECQKSTLAARPDAASLRSLQEKLKSNIECKRLIERILDITTLS